MQTQAVWRQARPSATQCRSSFCCKHQHLHCQQFRSTFRVAGAVLVLCTDYACTWITLSERSRGADCYRPSSERHAPHRAQVFASTVPGLPLRVPPPASQQNPRLRLLGAGRGQAPWPCIFSFLLFSVTLLASGLHKCPLLMTPS